MGSKLIILPLVIVSILLEKKQAASLALGGCNEKNNPFGKENPGLYGMQNCFDMWEKLFSIDSYYFSQCCCLERCSISLELNQYLQMHKVWALKELNISEMRLFVLKLWSNNICPCVLNSALFINSFGDSWSNIRVEIWDIFWKANTFSPVCYSHVSFKSFSVTALRHICVYYSCSDLEQRLKTRTELVR